MGAQGAWTKWPTTPRKLSWNDIWSYQLLRLAFLLKYVYDVFIQLSAVTVEAFDYTVNERKHKTENS